MDAEHSFKVDFEEAEKSHRPLPSSIKRPKKYRVKLPETYPKYEEEFFDVAKDCARYIDSITDVDKRIKLNNELNKIFIIRHRGLAMGLFKRLFDLTLEQKKEVSNG